MALFDGDSLTSDPDGGVWNPPWGDSLAEVGTAGFVSFRSHEPCDECPSLNAVPLAQASLPSVPRCRIDGDMAAAWLLLSVSFWNLSCRLIVRVLPSAPPDVPALRPGKAPSATRCSRSNSSGPPTTISGLGCLMTREVLAETRGVTRVETRVETRAASRNRKRTPPLPRKGLAVAGPSPVSRA